MKRKQRYFLKENSMYRGPGQKGVGHMGGKEHRQSGWKQGGVKSSSRAEGCIKLLAFILTATGGQ